MAQSVYVAGSLGGDISLVSGQESIGIPDSNDGGEAFSGAARLGVLLEPRWGIELEFSRATEIEDRIGPNPLAAGGSVGYAFSSVLPAFLPNFESRHRITTVSATGSIRQQVSDKVALAYLGGVVFHRTESSIDYRGVRGLSGSTSFINGTAVSGLLGLFDIPPGLVLPSFQTRTVQYGAGPVVGFEAHIGYGEHFLIIPGVRMHGLPGSWLVRPAIAAGWSF